MLRYLTAGESHGPALTAIIEGLPAGLALPEDYVNRQLARRQGGYGRGGRMRIEQDQVRFLAGVRGGFTLGSPVALHIENRDWASWQEIMDPGAAARLDQRVVTRPRPGHADLAGALKYGHRDIRNVLERASARETAARVAAGSVARRLLEELGIEIIGHVVRIGPVAVPEPGRDEDILSACLAEAGGMAEQGAVTMPTGVETAAGEGGGMCSGDVSTGAGTSGEREMPPPGKFPDLFHLRELLDASPVYCLHRETAEAMMREIDRAREAGDSLGGVFEIRVYGLPPGLGSYVHWDRRLDGRLAGALMSIQAIKGVEIGLGFAGAALPGSQVHDEIFYSRERGFYRRTNRAGGLEGGVTNGEPLIVRAAMKPIPTLYKPLRSVDLISKEPFAASVERSDVCAVPAACVVGEAVVAWELAAACVEKFGGDTLQEMKANYQQYLDYLKTRIW
ncbi:chorismate synthase [Desulfofundulus thermosubterraneus]|uniref:Chorismate synthase n=1 Tax=Desulfofundulus thermosubterraneus DSM 16057 TaxID=1121432 RepID=A0A1M6GF16_9FIRM|nr:chorismate synthase [Desulfofundulus thermosubterraneus]SHJ08554.1 chorismate synthase [Desulfofundulus thermosubterraneus DSM 16057]